MDPETLEAAISLSNWALLDAQKYRNIDSAIENLKRIYCFLSDTNPENLINYGEK